MRRDEISMDPQAASVGEEKIHITKQRIRRRIRLKTNIMRYSIQLAMLKQLLVKKLITEKEYRIIQQKLMNDYHISNNIMSER